MTNTTGEKKSGLRVLARMLRAGLRPHTKAIAGVMALQFVQTLAAVYLPSLNADIINNGVIGGDTGYILSTGGLMVAMAFAQIVCAAGAVYLGARVATTLGRDMRAVIFGRVQEFSAREMGHFGAASLITRTTNDVQQVQVLVMTALTMMISAPLMCLGGIAMALRQDVRMSALLVVVLPALGVALGLILRRMGPPFRAMQERVDLVNRVIREQITGIRVIRAFGREERERDRFAGANTALMEVSLRAGRLMALMFPAAMLVVNVSAVAVVWIGGHLVDGGSMEVGTMIAFLNYLGLILGSAIMATFTFLMVPRAEVCAVRIQEVLDTSSSVALPAAPVRRLTRRGHLEIRGAGFRYPGAEEPVLRGVDLVARPGETTAVIGSTGSGKSTLLSLVPRLFDVTEGAVLVGGVDVRELDPAVLSAAIGLVPQKPYLFTGTVASNLRYGKPDADEAELWHALEVAQARDFVEALPEGLDAPISQGGGNVSGGQRQRLAIARALVARPEIYLFDDSFSALDYGTDAALRAALARETGQAAMVIVAQRVSTIRHADRIVVLEEGRVAGIGTHDELMAAGGPYREIVLSQLTEEEAA
ncbi:ABC transporter ATP-binding protein [Streptosporangium sp. KLBMP 9127]|nr:ABC transporter ATP-binding protein/permease [Streptosporangium sp. KLBMP 9127]